MCTNRESLDLENNKSSATETQLFEESSGCWSSSSSSSPSAASSAGRIPAAIMIPTGILLYFLSLLTFVGNAMVLHAIRTDKRLQTVSNMFIMSLAIADLTVGLFVMPISSAYAITGDWKFGHHVCQFWLTMDYTASTASIFNLSILSLDRYWSITSPLRYLRKRTKKRALVMITMAWIGASMWFIPVLGWNQILRKGKSQLPDSVCETEFATNMTFKVVTSILNFYIPTSIITFLYVRIFFAIKSRSRDIVRFGAYTASGGSTVSNNASAKRSANKNISKKPSKCSTLPVGGRVGASISLKESHTVTNGGLKQNGSTSKSMIQIHEDPTKIEFHRLALVALPLDEKLTSSVKRTINRHTNGTDKGKCNTATHLSKANKRSSESNETLSVYDGVTVKIEYISTEDDEDSKNEDLASSKELLLSLEERKKVAASVTTIPLRQPLSANYKSSMITSVSDRTNSFNDHNHQHNHNPSGRRHSGHIQCYRSSRVSVTTTSPSNVLTLPATTKLRNSAINNHKKSSKKNHHHNGTTNGGEISTMTTLANGGESPNLSRGAKKANPNAVLAKEKKAATQLGVIVGAFILCWLPYFTLFMVVAYCGHDQCVNPTVFTITIWFGYFNSTLNPILYPLCNANFKTAFKRMLKLDCSKHSAASDHVINGVQYHQCNQANVTSKRI